MAAEQEPDRFRLRVLADGQEEVATKGRLRVRTDGALDEVAPEDVALLVLPGADTWSGGHERVLDLARVLVERQAPVAGICGATYRLARAGLLDDRAHTSNAPDFLVPSGHAGADRTWTSGSLTTVASPPLRPPHRSTSALRSSVAWSCSPRR
jgi:putative intracellular protease/amidase